MFSAKEVYVFLFHLMNRFLICVVTEESELLRFYLAIRIIAIPAILNTQFFSIYRAGTITFSFGIQFPLPVFNA